MSQAIHIKITSRRPAGAREPNLVCATATLGGYTIGTRWGMDEQECERDLLSAISAKLNVGVL